MNFTLMDFVNNLRNKMYNLFPYEDDEINYLKHVVGTYGHVKNPKPLHIRDVAFMDNAPMVINENMIVFEIGNEYAEREYPYYHILEDAPVIHKKNLGTERSKGSQDKVSDLSKRDYAIVSFNGKIFTKEYEKNIRGKRKSVINNSTRYVDGVKINQGSSTYENRHYHYLENMAVQINPLLAQEYGIEYVGSRGTSLRDDFMEQDRDYSLVSRILDM